MTANRPISSRPSDEFVALVRSVIRKSLTTRSLTIDGCAQQVGVSSRTLQRNLIEAGWSFSQLLDQVRLEMAAELLADENNTLRQIASQLDYANASNFARAFQRLTGVTPTQFRQNFATRNTVFKAMDEEAT